METIEKRNATDLAIASLVVASEKVNESLGPFSGWLTAGVAAVFSFLVANVDSASRFIDVGSIRSSLIYLILSLVAALVARLLSTLVSSSTAGHYAALELIKSLAASGQGMDLETYISEFERGLFWHQRWVTRRILDKVRAGDRAASARQMSKLTQILALFVIVQTAFIVIAAWLLVSGLKPM